MFVLLSAYVQGPPAHNDSLSSLPASWTPVHMGTFSESGPRGTPRFSGGVFSLLWEGVQHGLCVQCGTGEVAGPGPVGESVASPSAESLVANTTSLEATVACGLTGNTSHRRGQREQGFPLWLHRTGFKTTLWGGCGPSI